MCDDDDASTCAAPISLWPHPVVLRPPPAQNTHRGEARHQALREKLFEALAEEEREWGHACILAWVASKGLIGNATVYAQGDFRQKARSAAAETVGVRVVR